MNDQKQLWDNAHKNAHLSPHTTTHNSFAEEVRKHLPATGTLLELGCGEGNDSIYFAEQGFTVTATDFSAVVIEQNTTRYHNDKLTFVQQDIARPLQFADASFDAIYARLSLHYFTNEMTHAIFAELARVLKAGGKLGFMCKSIDDHLYGEGTQIEPDMFERDGHVRHFFSEAYVRELAAAGFDIELLQSGQEDIYGKQSGFVKAILRKNSKI